MCRHGSIGVSIPPRHCLIDLGHHTSVYSVLSNGAPPLDKPDYTLV